MEINFGRIKDYFSNHTDYELVSLIEEPLGNLKYITLYSLMDGKLLDFNLKNEIDKITLLNIVEGR